MNKSLIAVAMLAAAGAASAQSSVTLFGVVDAVIQHGSGSLSSINRLGSGALSSSILGFRGIEDLGGSLKAGFHLEADVAADNGQGGASNINNQPVGAGAAVNGRQGLIFNRRSTVSIGGDWGELRLGRDYTPHYVNQGVYDPFGNVGVGVSQTQASTIGSSTEVRASNSVSYLYGHGFNMDPVGTSGPNMQVMYYMGENNSNAANSKDGDGYSLRVGYNAGPFTTGISSGLTKYLAGDIRFTNAAASYNFDVAKLFVLLTRESVAGGATGKGYLFGGYVPVGANLIRMSYSRFETDAATNPKTAKLALGYVHYLSKRTALYATVAHARNSGSATASLNGSTTAAGTSSTGYDLGLRHRF